MQTKVLLAFSGGLDTSAIVPWLKEEFQADVICYCSDLGNAPDEKYLASWSKTLGASQFIFEDLKDHFAKEFAFRAVRAGALYQDDYLLGTALGRPLIAERMAHFAREFGVTHIAHGATGKGNDQLRFEKSWAYLIPDVEVIAPWKHPRWKFKGRSDLLAYLSKKGFPMEAKEKKYSVDVNLFHRSCEGGVLENPSVAYNPADIYEWVTPPGMATPKTEVTIEFKNGLPVDAWTSSQNKKPQSPAELLSYLNVLAGSHGVGVVDLVEERANGVKSRGVYETPGGTLLHLAIKALKHLVWDKSLQTLARGLGQEYASLVYDGLWHTDSRCSVDAFFERAAQTIHGTVTLILENGTARVTKRESNFSLYDELAVTFESDENGLHQHAVGYSKTVSFPLLRSGKRDSKTGHKLI